MEGAPPPHTSAPRTRVSEARNGRSVARIVAERSVLSRVVACAPREAVWRCDVPDDADWI